MSSSPLLEDYKDTLDEAIENGWPLRGSYPSDAYVTTGSIEDKSLIAKSSDYIDQYPKMSKLSLMQTLLPGLLIVDVDTFDADKIQQTRELFNKLYGDNQYLRIGNKDKLGQYLMYFPGYDDFLINQNAFTPSQLEKCEFIYKYGVQNRCDMLGYYKDTDYIYQYPFKKFWEVEYTELPQFGPSLYFPLYEIFGPSDKQTGASTLAYSQDTRHGRTGRQVSIDVAKNEPMIEVCQKVFNSEDFHSMKSEPGRKVEAEIARMIGHAAQKRALELLSNGIPRTVINETITVLSNVFPLDQKPRVEKGSFFDVYYKSIRRNQFTDNKIMAVANTLSVCGWLGTFNYRFRGLRSNMMIVTIAPSGAGKSTANNGIKQLLALIPFLMKSQCGDDVRTDSSIFKAVEECPVVYFNIDEISKIIKSSKNQHGHTHNLQEIFCQLYSDYGDNILHKKRIKNETYGVCYGPKMNLFGASTEYFWEVFDETNYVQGLGRRLFIFKDELDSKLIKHKKHTNSFFNNEEKNMLGRALDCLIPGGQLYTETKNVEPLKLIKRVKSNKGNETVITWDKCKAINKPVDLTASDEVENYFTDELIDKINTLKEEASASGSNISKYIISSIPEMMIKLCIIYTLFGKSQEKNSYSINTIVEMDAVKWSEKMIGYYLLDSLLDKLNDVYGKSEEIDNDLRLAQEFLEKLKEVGEIDFKKSDGVVKDFFRYGRKGKRDSILLKMINNNMIKCNGDFNKKGVKMEVIYE